MYVLRLVSRLTVWNIWITVTDEMFLPTSLPEEETS